MITGTCRNTPSCSTSCRRRSRLPVPARRPSSRHSTLRPSVTKRSCKRPDTRSRVRLISRRCRTRSSTRWARTRSRKKVTIDIAAIVGRGVLPIVDRNACRGDRRPTMRRNAVLLPALIIGVYLVFSTGPIIWLMLSSIKDRQDLFAWPPTVFFRPVWTGYEAVFGVGSAQNTATAVGLYDSLVNSVVISGFGTMFAVVLGTLGGYATSRFRFPGHGDFMFFVLSTRMIPPGAGLVFYHMLYSRL